MAARLPHYLKALSLKSSAVLSANSIPSAGPTTCGATVRGTYGTPEAGTRTAHVQRVGPGGKLPCASGTYSPQEAGTRHPHVHFGGAGTYVSA